MRPPRFSRYVSEQNQLNGDVSEELAMLEGVLKEEQMEWLKAMVAEKNDLRSRRA